MHICRIDIYALFFEEGTMTELIILGFLSYGQAFTLYDIKKAMERSTEYFASTSQGSIHPALKKLCLDNCIYIIEKVENNRVKKYYSITEYGKIYFSKRMRHPFEPDKYRSIQLLKMMFFYELTKQERLESIAAHIDNFRSMEKSLEQIREEGRKRHEELCSSQDHVQRAKYEEDALEFGLDYANFVIEWYEKYYAKIEREL